MSLQARTRPSFQAEVDLRTVADIHFDLSGNVLGAEGAQSLVGVFVHFTTLVHLDSASMRLARWEERT